MLPVQAERMEPSSDPVPAVRPDCLIDPVRALICGVPVDALTMSQSVAAAELLIADECAHQHVAVNAAKLVMAKRDGELSRIIRSCSLVNADGQAVVWASRILGCPLPERVAGIDLMLELWKRAAGNCYRVYLLGAEPAVVRKAAAIASRQGVNVVGCRDGFWAEDEEPAVVAAVREARPDILFLAVPTPLKERFLARHLTDLNCGLAVGVGGSFDVVAGVRRRAPVWMRKTGLEWSFRLLQEPRRLLARYLLGNSRFIALILSQAVRQRIGRRGPWLA
ncbi:WecB/TagA/CpsF family glycosyltransferase [Streptomyces sp. NPDC002187]|uniref:WecB/TagA/CpsF family glycosyltransferase n=1 Tax=Streptomyces sp. NPDC002187 TaxID=3364637 RepID=UPI0036CA1A9F